MRDIKVSIILPIYDVADYLKRALDSCVNQTLQEIEIVAVNDCSPDARDTEIMREYEKKYPNKMLCIWHEKNRGSGGARNTGIDAAHGEYIVFCDPDDYLELNLCELAYDIGKKENLDLLSWDHFTENGDEKKKVPKRLDMFPFIWTPAFWQHMARRELLIKNALYAPEGVIHQDLGILPLYYLCAEKVSHIHLPLYHYCRDNANSIIKKYYFEPRYFTDFHKCFEHLFYLSKKLKVYDSEKYLLDYYVFHTMLLYIQKNPGLLPFETLHELLNSLITLYNPDYENNMLLRFDSDVKQFCLTFSDHDLDRAWDRFKSLIFSKISSFSAEQIVEIFEKHNCVTLWGAGKRCKFLVKHLKLLCENKEYYVTDNNPAIVGTFADNNLYVHSWEEIKHKTDAVIITPKLYEEEIYSQLETEHPEIALYTLSKLM